MVMRSMTELWKPCLKHWGEAKHTPALYQHRLHITFQSSVSSSSAAHLKSPSLSRAAHAAPPSTSGLLQSGPSPPPVCCRAEHPKSLRPLLSDRSSPDVAQIPRSSSLSFLWLFVLVPFFAMAILHLDPKTKIDEERDSYFKINGGKKSEYALSKVINNIYLAENLDEAMNKHLDRPNVKDQPKFFRGTIDDRKVALLLLPEVTTKEREIRRLPSVIKQFNNNCENATKISGCCLQYSRPCLVFELRGENREGEDVWQKLGGVEKELENLLLL